jgi:hypothetical protein
MSAVAMTNLEEYLWSNYIARIEVPTIEVYMATTNDIWATSIYPEPQLTMDAVVQQGDPTNLNIRGFRYQDSVDATSLALFRTQRAQALAALDREVKSRFLAIGGREVTSLAEVVDFTPDENLAINQAVRDANAKATLEMRNLGDDGFGSGNAWFETSYRWDPDWPGGFPEPVTFCWTSTLHVDGFYRVITNSYEIGGEVHEYGEWEINLSAGVDSPLTNETFRVDAHQDQLMKTLWRFKNLREPDQ